MVHLAWLYVTDLSCGSPGLVVCDRSELWFIWLGLLYIKVLQLIGYNLSELNRVMEEQEQR